MYIELTDHLRCPAEHDEAYLVLLPDAVERRGVARGRLGCPVCGAEWTVADGAWRSAPPPAWDGPAAALPPAEALAALLGLGGPGGYAVLVGDVARLWRDLATLVEGVALVAVNPPAGVRDEPPRLSVVEGTRLPLKRRSMRGVVLGPGYGGASAWVAEAVRVVLPGRRVVGVGPTPDRPGLDVLAHADGVWVAAVQPPR